MYLLSTMVMPTTKSQFHVLAVDDSIIDRKLIERLLKTASYQVTTVDSGSKALEFLGFCEDVESNSNEPSISPNNQQEVEVNLIITDYCMPEMTGYDLLKKIKESSSFRDIPVVIMSSENVPSRITRCLEEGAEEFFLKPVRLADVNKLKPHMMKTKSRDCQKPEQEEVSSQEKIASLVVESSEQPQQEDSDNTKRKATEMEEELSQDRTRRRYNGLTVI